MYNDCAGGVEETTGNESESTGGSADNLTLAEPKDLIATEDP